MEARKLALVAVFCLVLAMLPSHTGNIMFSTHKYTFTIKSFQFKISYKFLLLCYSASWTFAARVCERELLYVTGLCAFRHSSRHVRGFGQRVDENGNRETWSANGNRAQQVSVCHCATN